jgi:rare lipoprotein A
VNVKVVDRGPHIKGRIVDLSQAAARKLGFLKNGITKVRVEVVEMGDGKTHFKN